MRKAAKKPPKMNGGRLVRRSVEQEYHEVEVAGKCDPGQIRDLQIGCGAVDAGKSAGHGQDEQPEYGKPYKGEQIGAHVEKQDTPKEIEEELGYIERQCAGTRCALPGAHEDPGQAPRHEDIQDGPNGWKGPGRRREGGLFDRL